MSIVEKIVNISLIAIIIFNILQYFRMGIFKNQGNKKIKILSDYIYIRKSENILLILGLILISISGYFDNLIRPSIYVLGYFLWLHYLLIKLKRMKHTKALLLLISILIPLVLISLYINSLSIIIKDINIVNVFINLIIILFGFLYYIYLVQNYVLVNFKNIFKLMALGLYLLLFYFTVGVSSIFFENNMKNGEFDFTSNIQNHDLVSEAVGFMAKGIEFTSGGFGIKYIVTTQETTNDKKRFKTEELINNDIIHLKIFSKLNSAIFGAILLDLIIKIFSYNKNIEKDVKYTKNI